ncbi:hypothetical protein CDQ92_09775 [Sphingopyxis bauzanensis]|uniref:Uncharacterized protein n=1 Tax=Sphingopyxis bauzanensis TaxID=651663 RepID=A0A246JW84_9SPHN|nr:hypothetical protein [Sphingopyxis bauzanensis]OWQ97320.1 hypothetical protein CDQ92_09775 [Sphingopyxis bauzanensis]GGJ49259.1 hypothetical protein GCM10011393_19310 [Sphingopyxis bauzanensis]
MFTIDAAVSHAASTLSGTTTPPISAGVGFEFHDEIWRQITSRHAGVHKMITAEMALRPKNCV